MKTNDFTAVGYINTVFETEFQLIDGREIQSVGFELITEDHLRFECQTDDGVSAFAKLQRIARKERANAALQRLKTHGWKAEDSDANQN